MNLDNYRVVRIVDCENNNAIYEEILLNNKHSVKDLQRKIIEIKNEYYDEIMEYGNDWEIIKGHLDNIDYIEMSTDEDYIEL